MPAGIIRDSPEIVKSDVEVIKAVIAALNKKDIYYDKEVSIMHINKLQKVTSKTVKNVADELITLLQDNNCFNIRKELEKKINWKRSDKEDLPKFFELLLINYLYRNTIDIKDLHHNSWLVSQYDLLLETGKCGLDLQ
jgi:ATP phosphoribosyltransferase regulatory subunit HisZ